MVDDQSGFDTNRFPNLKEEFVCPICTCVAKDPQECPNCGALFCKKCTDSWLAKKKTECPRSRCNIQANPLRPIKGMLLRLYKDLDIKCVNYDKCKKVEIP